MGLIDSDRAGRLARRIRARCAQRGWDVSDLAREAGVSRTTAHQLLAGETRQPHLSTLARIAGALGVSVAELSTEVEKDVAVSELRTHEAATLDRQTNPRIFEVAEESPQLFAGWTTAEWDELYSTFGTGGALTAEGVRDAASAINRKRETVRKVQVLLETHLADVATQLVEALYRMVRPLGNLEPAPSLRELLDFRRPRSSDT